MSKTKEERLAANRERQRRWRAEHRWLGEQRRLKTYGMSKAHADEGFDTNNASVQRIEVVVPESGEKLSVLVDGRTKTGRLLLVLWQRVKDLPEVCDDPSGRKEEPVTKLVERPGVEVEDF